MTNVENEDFNQRSELLSCQTLVKIYNNYLLNLSSGKSKFLFHFQNLILELPAELANEKRTMNNLNSKLSNSEQLAQTLASGNPNTPA